MKKIFSSDPIDYYIPIIDGWVASDRFLNGLSGQTGRSTKAGAILAGIYFMDMAQEHFGKRHIDGIQRRRQQCVRRCQILRFHLSVSP